MENHYLTKVLTRSGREVTESKSSAFAQLEVWLSCTTFLREHRRAQDDLAAVFRGCFVAAVVTCGMWKVNFMCMYVSSQIVKASLPLQAFLFPYLFSTRNICVMSYFILFTVWHLAHTNSKNRFSDIIVGSASHGTKQSRGSREEAEFSFLPVCLKLVCCSNSN